MKSYPSIPADVSTGGNWYVFDKIDGSNIRAEWTKKKGFHKFGSRQQLIGARAESDQQETLSEAIDLIKAQEDFLAKVFIRERWDRRGRSNTPVVCFFEFWGKHSFAGLHEDEEHYVSLIDVSIYKHGMLDPRDFVRHFSGVVDVPELLSKGPFTRDLEEQVRAGTLPWMTFEGVVAKAPRRSKWETVPMFKVKNRAWVEAVKERYGEKAEELL